MPSGTPGDSALTGGLSIVMTPMPVIILEPNQLVFGHVVFSAN